jgi:4-hydroxythreonine-4-phosphate dehydrogenase
MRVVRPAIAVTIGDPNGIGPEIAVKAAAAWADRPEARVVLFGDAFVIGHYADQLRVRVREAEPDAPADCGMVDLVDVAALAPDAFRPGEVSAEAGRATVAYLSAAFEQARAGRVSALVGRPHSETAINASGLAFSGYPSLMARLADLPEDHVFLMLVGGGVRIVHATLHERLQDALRRLTPELIVRAADAAAEALRALGRPRIGVFGINPHAGEGGLFGDDATRVTLPAVEQLRARGLDVHGPVGADLMLSRREGFDAFVAMYHDQGHMPVKLLADRGASALSIVADTLFSGVGHGAAFDIAGKGEADPEAVMRKFALLCGAAATEHPVTRVSR